MHFFGGAGQSEYNNDTSAIYQNLGGGGNYEGIQQLNGLPKNVAIDLPMKSYPRLVMFKDINDPNSVTEIIKIKNTVPYPPKWEIVENSFEELFGQGIALKEITIEITDEPLTEGIDQHIPWLLSYKKTFPPSDPQNFNNQISYFSSKSFLKK